MKDKTKISTEWNYLAGMVDGDGSLVISAHPHKENYINYDTAVNVGLTHLPTIKWLQETFGGQFYTTQDKRPNRKTQSPLVCEHSRSPVVDLKMISPRLRLKREQGEALIEFVGLGGRYFQDPQVRKDLADFVAARNEISFLCTEPTTKFLRLGLIKMIINTWLVFWMPKVV